MSGIEVAGIVLACVPLVFNAIDSYKAGKSQLAIFRKYGSILKTLIRELESQHVFFQNNLEILLKSAGVKNIEAARFGQDNADLAWIAGADERVRDYLDASYAPFCNTVEAYRNVAETIALRMQDSKSVFEPGSKSVQELLPATKRPEGGYDFRRRLRFTLSKSEIQGLIDELQRSNANLGRFCSDAQKLRELDDAAAAPTRKAGRIATSLSRVRGQTGRLFDAVSSKWSTCHPKHEANIRLEPRLEGFDRRSRSLSSVPTFNLGLGHTSEHGHGIGIQWFQVGVLHRDPYDALSRPSDMSIVRIQSDDMDEQQSRPKGEDILDLCKSIAEANEAGHTLRFHVNEDDTLISRCEGAVRAPMLCSHEHAPISLTSIIEGQSRALGVKMKLADRMKTAITLASNLLQLSGTAWISEGPMKDSVMFPPARLATKRSTSLAVDVAHPFLCTDHSAAPQVCLPRNALLELGIVLMELWHNQTIESYFQNTVVGSDYYGRLVMVHRWVDETEEDMVPRHSRAVRSCIRCCVNKGGDLDDAAFGTEVVETVLIPLMENARDVDA